MATGDELTKEAIFDMFCEAFDIEVFCRDMPNDCTLSCINMHSHPSLPQDRDWFMNFIFYKNGELKGFSWGL